MEIINELKDTEYPDHGFDHTREVVRALVLDENGNIAIHEVQRDDQFGDQKYFETPGGGVDEGESLEEAIHRECKEELGYEIEILAPIGIVIDFYNLINRKNINHYYLAKRTRFVGKHFVSKGDDYIKNTIWVKFEKAEQLYSFMPDTLVSKLVKNRELPVIVKGQKVLASLTSEK